MRDILTKDLLIRKGFKKNKDGFYYLEGFDTEHLVLEKEFGGTFTMGVNHTGSTSFFVWDLKYYEDLREIYLLLTKKDINNGKYDL